MAVIAAAATQFTTKNRELHKVRCTSLDVTGISWADFLKKKKYIVKEKYLDLE